MRTFSDDGPGATLTQGTPDKFTFPAQWLVKQAFNGPFNGPLKKKHLKEAKLKRGKCHFLFYRLQNEAVLSDKHQSYQQRHRAMNCVTPSLQKKVLFEEIFLSGSWSFLDWWVGMTRSDSPESGWQLIPHSNWKMQHTIFFFFCSSRISNRVIQCDGFLEWQNAP